MAKQPTRVATVSPQPALARLRLPFGIAPIVPIAAIFASLIFMWRIALVGLAIGLVALVVFAFESIKAAISWRSPTIELAPSTLVLGGRPVLTYRRKARKVRDIGEFGIDCTLLCYETTVSTEGIGEDAEQMTEISAVVDRVVKSRGFGTSAGVEANLEIEIPQRLGGPSGTPRGRVWRSIEWLLGSSGGTYEWRLETATFGEGLPDDSHVFRVQVRPFEGDMQHDDRAQDL